MTENKKVLNLWTKLCLKRKKTPICLITVSDDGFPHVYSNHDSKTLEKVFRHLIDVGAIEESAIIDNEEN